MYWYKIEVYNHEWFLGSFYTDSHQKQNVIKEINEKYGSGKWTRYTIE